MVATTSFERQARGSTPGAFRVNKDKTWKNVASDVEVSKHLFDLIPCNSRLRYCVDVGSRNGEHFVDDTLITHSLLVSNDREDHDQREGSEGLADNDHELGQNTWFGVLLQPDENAFQSLQRLHQPLGNLCLQISPSVEEGSFNNNKSLESILRQHVSELPIDFDFLGLYEVGYSNYWLLRNFLGNSSYRPKVVCISYDNRRPTDVAYIPDPNNEHELPSIKSLMDLMSVLDYQLVTTTARCCFFSTKELYQSFLGTGMRQPEIPTVSQRLNITDNSFFNRQQSPRAMMIKSTQSIHPSSGVDDRSESLGTKWLLQRRKMLDSEDSETMAVSSKHAAVEWKTRTKLMSMEQKMGMETKWNGATKDIQLPKMQETMVAWRTPKSTANDMIESRDDIFISSPKTTPKAEREGSETLDFVDEREPESRDIVDAIRSTKETKSQPFSPDPVGDSRRVVAPDPVGDTIVQKMSQDQPSITENSLTDKKTEHKDKIGNQKAEEKAGALTFPVTPNDQSPEGITDSLLDLKNEILKLRQEMKEGDIDIISETFETNEINDDLSPSEPLDLTAICDPTEQSNEKERSECAKNLVAKLRRNGHAMICGTSISRFICSDALYASHMLLSEADESVRSSCQSQSPIQRGYTPKCTERSNSGGLTDMVRKFRLGSENGSMTNVWPMRGMLDEETDEYIRNSFQEYHDNLRRVAISITKCVHETIACNVRKSQITKPINSTLGSDDPNSSLLTAFNCEHGSRHETMKPLVASHNDPSLVTILLLDGGDCATIQHEVSEGHWQSVALSSVLPLDPIFMIYAGENLQKLSGGLIPSKARSIVPFSGDKILNGLSFSLMPSDGRTYPSKNEKPANLYHEELPNPVSKLASELNDIDEMFRSIVFDEDDGAQCESEYEDYFDEDFDFMMDPFAYDDEDARDMRRSHIESHRLRARPSRASDPLRRETVGVSTSRGKKSSRRRRATIGGTEVERPKELLGSSHLPIVLETKDSVSKEIIKVDETTPREIIKIDENFKPMPVVVIEKRVEQNRGQRFDTKRDERADTKFLLPVAPAFNPPSRQSRSSPRRAKSASPRKTRSSTPTRMRGSTPTKTRSSSPTRLRSSTLTTTRISTPTKSRILYDPNYKGRKLSEPINQNHRLTKNDIVSPRSQEIERMKNESSRIRRKDAPKGLMDLLEENSVQSSDASAILDEILGDSEAKAGIEQTLERARRQTNQPWPILKTPKIAKQGTPRNSEDPIFKNCRESLSLQQAMLKTCDEVAALPHPPSATNLGSLTKNNTLYNQKQSGKPQQHGKKREQKKSGDDYVPFRGSVVEWKMQEKTKRIKNTSLLWEQRGYKFGSENGKKGKKQGHSRLNIL